MTSTGSPAHSANLSQIAASFLPTALLPVVLFVLCTHRPLPKLFSTETLILGATGLLGISGALGFAAVSGGRVGGKALAGGWVALLGQVALYAFMGPAVAFDPRLVASGRAEGRGMFVLTLSYFTMTCITILAKALVLGVSPVFEGTMSINGFRVAEGATTLVLEAFLLICSVRLSLKTHSKIPQPPLPPSPSKFKPLSLPLKYAEKQASPPPSNPPEVISSRKLSKQQLVRVARAPFVTAQTLAVISSMLLLGLAIKAKATRSVSLSSGPGNLALAALFVARVVITLAQGLYASTHIDISDGPPPARPAHRTLKFFGNHNGSTFSNFRWPSPSSSTSMSREEEAYRRRWSAPPRLQLSPNLRKYTAQSITTSTPPRHAGVARLRYLPKPLTNSTRSGDPLLEIVSSPASSPESLHQRTVPSDLFSPNASPRNSDASSRNWWRRSGFSDHPAVGRMRSDSMDEGESVRTSLDASVYRMARMSLSTDKRGTLDSIQEGEEKSLDGRVGTSSSGSSRSNKPTSSPEASCLIEMSPHPLSAPRRKIKPSPLTLHTNLSFIGRSAINPEDTAGEESPDPRATSASTHASSFPDIRSQTGDETPYELRSPGFSPSSPLFVPDAFGEIDQMPSPPISPMPEIYVTAPTAGGAASRPSTGSLSLLSARRGRAAAKRSSQESFQCAGPGADSLVGGPSSSRIEASANELPATEASAISVFRGYFNRPRRPSVTLGPNNPPIGISVVPSSYLRSMPSPTLTSHPLEAESTQENSSTEFPSSSSLGSQREWGGWSHRDSLSGSGNRPAKTKEESDDSAEWEPFGLEANPDEREDPATSMGLGLTFNDGYGDEPSRGPSHSHTLSMSAFFGRRPIFNRSRPSELTITHQTQRQDEGKALLETGITPPLTPASPATPLTWPSPRSEAPISPVVTSTNVTLPVPMRRAKSTKSQSSIYSQDSDDEREFWHSRAEVNPAVGLGDGKSHVIAIGSQGNEGGERGSATRRNGMW